MNTRRLLFTLALVVGLVPAVIGQQFEARTFTDKNGGTLPYRLLTPKDYQPGKKYPLVFFFHGAGERGDDNKAQLTHGTSLYLEPANRDKYPCFVVAPQCPKNKQWVDMPWGADKGKQPKNPSVSMQLAIDLLDSLPKEFSIDPDRIYITGLSMGGFATWDIITRFPDRFAAAAPICGGGDEAVVAKVAKLPIWAFHSEDDNVVKVTRTRNMIATIKKAGGHPHYFEYYGLRHNSWTTAYKEQEFLPWMFAQRRGQPDTYNLKTPQPEAPAIARIPDTDDGLPGAGPIRRYDWFRNLWKQRRLQWSRDLKKDQGAVVFLGDSITQKWGDTMGNSFPHLKVANRGISGDTTRGVLIRLKEDVLDLHPKAVVLLIGTNDLEEQADPKTIADNVALILEEFKKNNPKMPVILCKVFPSSPLKKRPKEKIDKVNELYTDLVKDNPQVTLVDTWTIFANEEGNAKKEEFPDLLHPNNTGYAKWTAALNPVLTKLNLLKP